MVVVLLLLLMGGGAFGGCQAVLLEQPLCCG
jgi:hypothetical protein